VAANVIASNRMLDLDDIRPEVAENRT